MRRITTSTREQNKFGPGKDGFTNGDPIAGAPSTDLEGEWFDAVQEELAGFIEGSGQALNPDSFTQLRAAIMATCVQRLATIPNARIALPGGLGYVDQIYVANFGEMVWTDLTWSGGSWSGYLSPECGRVTFGHTTAPLAREVDAVGGLLPKASPYMGLLSMAYKNGLVVSQATWTANVGGFYFVDVDANTFRVPDLRNMFLRFTGTDADTANARTLGSRQTNQNKAHTHAIPNLVSLNNGTLWRSSEPYNGMSATATGSSGGAESRPDNTALNPRVHV